MVQVGQEGYGLDGLPQAHLIGQNYGIVSKNRNGNMWPSTHSQCRASHSLAPSVSQPVQPVQLVVPQLEALLLPQSRGLVLHYPEPRPVLEHLVAPPRDAVRVVASDEGVDLLLEESGDYCRTLPCALRIG